MSVDKRFNEIIRVQRVAGNFATMNKSFLEDNRLSMKAKGILAYLLSKPNNWKVIVADIVKHCKDGKSAIYAGLKELKENGYYKKEAIRSEDGSRIVRWESTVYEVPMEIFSDEELEQKKTSTLEKEVKRIKEIEQVEKTEQLITKLEEKITKTEQKQSISLFPNLQEIENQVLVNKECNNNYNTNNYTTKIYSSSSQTGIGKTLIEKMSTFFKRKIHYNDLIQEMQESDIGLVNEFVHVALDCLLSDGDIVRINGENKPRELVKSRLMKLTYGHFIYILENFKAQTHKIKKKRQYMLSMLYNVTMELESHYYNAVATDLGI